MRTLRLLGILIVAGLLGLGATGCTALFGKPLEYRTLSASERSHLASYTDVNGKNLDPGMSVLKDAGYIAPLYRDDDLGPRLFLIKCGDHSMELCPEKVRPTIEAPHVVVMLKSAPNDKGQFEPSGAFRLMFPNEEGGNPNNEIRCDLQGSAPSGVTRGASGLWKELPAIFTEMGRFFTTQDYRDFVHVTDPNGHTKTMTDGSTWFCDWVYNG